MEKSFKFFKRVIDVDPDNAATNYKLGQLLTEKRDFNQALPYATRAMDLDPQNKFYYLHLGDLLKKIKAWKPLSECYEKML